MTRRGFLASNILNFWAYVCFLLVIIAAAVWFKMGEERIEFIVTSEAGYSDTNLALLNILRTPTAPGENTADLIAAAINSGEWKDLMNRLEYDLKPTLDTFMKENFYSCCWHMKLQQGPKTLYTLEGAYCSRGAFDQVESSFYLPAASGTTPIEVILVLHKGSEADTKRRGCVYKNE